MKLKNGLGTFGLLVLSVSGCAAPARMAVRAERYTIDVQVDPASNHLSGRTTLDLTADRDAAAVGYGPVFVELQLHPDLMITSVRASGAEVVQRSATKASPATASLALDEPPSPPMTTHQVVLRQAVEALTLHVEFEGRLVQDVAAGEKPGQIHNFTMRAHVAREGVYLADGCWYPQPIPDPLAPALSEFTLTAHAPPGFELIASGERDEALAASVDGFAWRSPYPLPQMSLVGGPLQVFRDRYREHDIAVYLSPAHAGDANIWLTAIKKNLDRYEPLIGPLPARDYAVVENFFSSGFAFPGFTLLSSAVIAMGERSANTHGYLDHEMLHSWWGNGVFVDPRDGNWCEALTSYCTNYYGHVLDGNEEEARRKRRNYSHFFSRLKPGDDKPLGTFGLPGGCNRSIAYDKGAMVFHMLAARMGQESFWAAMQNLVKGRTGEFASWDTIRTTCETMAGSSFDVFFDQWVRRAGAPSIQLDSARFDSEESTLSTVLRQGEPLFWLDEVPLTATALDMRTGTRSVETLYAESKEETQKHSLVVRGTPSELILDPDYHVLRKVAPDELVPTTAATRRGGAFAAVMPKGLVSEEYVKLKRSFESSFDSTKRIERSAGQIEEGALAERSTLILGEAVRDAYVDAFLTAIEFPITWDEDAFEFDEEVYDEPGDAVLCTIRHPDVAGGGVTVVYANSEAAIPKAAFVPMYEHSLIIFRDGKPVLRQDFEKPHAIKVEYGKK